MEIRSTSVLHAKQLQLCPTLCDCMDSGLQSIRLICPWDSPGKNTGVDYHALLQGIFPTQGLNLSLMSPALADGSLSLAPPGKYRSTSDVELIQDSRIILWASRKKILFFFFQITLRATYSRILCLSQRGSIMIGRLELSVILTS